jgi:hypothetical protein
VGAALTLLWFIFGVNMTRKIGFGILSLLLLAFQAQAQKFEGPKKAEARTLIELKITGDLGDDPQVMCFPESGNWKLVRAVTTNDLTIMFVPVDSEDGTSFDFLFVSAKEKKVISARHTIVVGGAKPNPKPNPTPDPVKPNRFTDQLKAKYLVSPDAQALDALIGVLMQVQVTKFNTWTDARNALINAAKRDIDAGGAKKLPGVRDEIAYAILAKEIGDDGDKEWPQEKFASVLTEVIQALKSLK